MHSVARVDALKVAIQPGNRLVVDIGYIGIEVAAVAVTQRLKVTALEAVDRVMARVVCRAREYVRSRPESWTCQATALSWRPIQFAVAGN